ncbi:MAG: hypothetical protein JWM95_1509 [Gemmatimonadetes bacterium]|nr:hypothetical protein [Gemmatimonadota bacterium]
MRAVRYLAFIVLSLSFGVRAQAPVDTTPPPVMRELRAIWIATVDNLDWPSRAGLSTEAQKAELIAMLDKAVDLHMNAVIFQVRPGADALYDSKIEPWSEYLTGEMGRAPNPYYDPLAFAVTEAHNRGLELHAWINPYRARYSLTRKASANHVSRAHPELTHRYGSYVWMDPGDPAVRARTTRVVLDIVKRYDIDALHMDDYFYPYKELKRGKEIPFPDNATYRRYRNGGGKLGRDDWRRHNVDLLVEELNAGIHKVKPSVRFGISPFGIWRPGYPASVRGLDQYGELYADARKWWREGWVDYLTPQLYFGPNRPQQRYDDLLQWWADENVKGRHLWPGNYTGKVGFTNASRFPTSVIIDEIRMTRAQPGATGNVHFSMKVFMQDPDSLNERLLRESYAMPALVPATTWLPGAGTAAPSLFSRIDSASGDRVFEVTSGKPARTPWLWVIQARADAGWTTRILPGSPKLHVPVPRAASVDIRVMSVDRVGNLSPAARLR